MIGRDRSPRRTMQTPFHFQDAPDLLLPPTFFLPSVLEQECKVRHCVYCSVRLSCREKPKNQSKPARGIAMFVKRICEKSEMAAAGMSPSGSYVRVQGRLPCSIPDLNFNFNRFSTEKANGIVPGVL